MNWSKRKALGQHFLKDNRILSKIVDTIDPKPEDCIVEIGPGKGKLTFPLAEKAGRMIGIEKDKSLISNLEKSNYPHLSIINNDILKIEFDSLNIPVNSKLVGNLPYAISSLILFKVFEEQNHFSICVFLLQKEVAQRLCAGPGTKKYAPLSILFNNYFETKYHFSVPPIAFSPPPKVDSALISLTKRDYPLIEIPDELHFRQFLKQVFMHRRKTLTNNLKAMGYIKEQTNLALSKCEIDSNLRPEDISAKQFISLFVLLKKNQTT